MSMRNYRLGLSLGTCAHSGGLAGELCCMARVHAKAVNFARGGNKYANDPSGIYPSDSKRNAGT